MGFFYFLTNYRFRPHDECVSDRFRIAVSVDNETMRQVVVSADNETMRQVVVSADNETMRQVALWGGLQEK